MLFNGGLVSTYIMYTQTFHVKNTLWALILPNLLTNAFYIIMVRNYFASNIPEELLEAARIDGCSEAGIFARVVFPLSKPIIATVGLMVGVAYWNDWQNGLYYIDNQKLYGIQNILNAINENAKYLMTGGGSAVMQMPANTSRMAAAVIGIIPILIIYPFFQDYFVKGITMGAVKG
jgi:putative aldouronate transport system permease protein